MRRSISGSHNASENTIMSTGEADPMSSNSEETPFLRPVRSSLELGLCLLTLQ